MMTDETMTDDELAYRLTLAWFWREYTAHPLHAVRVALAEFVVSGDRGPLTEAVRGLYDDPELVQHLACFERGYRGLTDEPVLRSCGQALRDARRDAWDDALDGLE